MGNRGILILGLLVGLGACGNIAVSDECDCGFYTIAGTDRTLHWTDGSEISFQLDQNLPDAYKLAMHQVANEYNDVFAKTRVRMVETRDAHGFTTATTPAPAYAANNPKSASGDGINGIYWVTGTWPWAESDPEADAMTVLIFSKAGIAEADIYFRADNFGNPGMTDSKSRGLYSPTEGYDVAGADRETQFVYVLGLHEMGHALGRVHSHSKESVMYRSVGLSFVKSSLTDLDLEILAGAYALKGDARAAPTATAELVAADVAE